jgi:protein O-GlcNAc transferase
MNKTEQTHMLEKAVAHYHKKEYNIALSICQSFSGKEELFPDFLYLAGLIFRESKMYEQAAYNLHRAILLSPEKPSYYLHLGVVYHMNKCLDEALICYKKTLELKYDYSEAYNNMGKAMEELGNLKEAEECFQKALALDTGNYQSRYNLAVCYQMIGDLEAAEQNYEKCLERNPDDIFALNNLGIIYHRQDKPQQAVQQYERVVALNPEYYEVYNNLGALYADLGELGKAVDNYKKSYSMRPGNERILSNLVDQLKYACLWDELDPYLKILDHNTIVSLKKGIKPEEQPFSSIRNFDDPDRAFAIAKAYADEIKKKIFNCALVTAKKFDFSQRRMFKGQLKIGYLSNDFIDHAVAHILTPLFVHHDHNAFKINCYSYGNSDSSPFREKIIQGCDRFIDISHLSDEESAERIYCDGIDILVDLKGYTHFNRMPIFAMRPAPIQISYLGFLGTTGADFMDYIIADRIVIPEDQQQNYSEKVVYIPCYQVTDYSGLAPEKKYQRKDWGLPEDGFVMCSFNQPYKFDPKMFDVWMRVMARIPKSVLWLRWTSDLAVQNLRKEAEKRGVNGSRLIFAPKTFLGDHLSRLALADIALDTRVYNGGATTSNALWAGVPVVTLQGRQFVARMSSSSLAAIGLSELTVSSLGEYESLCLKLADQTDYLARLKTHLAEKRTTAILFNVKAFTQNIESAFCQMWKNRHA